MLIIVGGVRIVSLWLIVIMVPITGMYIRMLNGIQGGLPILESRKKLCVIILVMLIGIVVVELLYVLGYIFVTVRIVGTVYMRTYAYIMMSEGL